MSRPASVRSTLGVLLASAVTVGLLVAPFALSWGAKEHVGSSPGDRAEQNEWRKFRQLPRFTAVERVADLSPFGPGFQADKLDKAAAGRKGLIETAIGYVDLKHADQGVTKRLPAALKHDAASVKVAGSKGKGLISDVNIVQVSAEALAARGSDDIEAALRTHGRVLESVPDRGYLVRAHSERELSDLAAESFVEAIAPFEAGYKIAPSTGRLPLMERKRARSTDLDLIVALWSDADADAVRGDLEAIAGKGRVSAWNVDGTILNVKGSVQAAQRLAKHAGVRSISERYEYVLTNSETPTLLMLGQTEFSDGMSRPYHELGIDGGGIDTNADGRRLNNDSDTVPPQIITVTDNGISYDAVHFSQTLTQTTTLANPLGPSHRKIHQIQNVTDSGQSCDGVLFGSNTHGNVVAGIIAGAPGDFGLTFAKAIDPADGPPVTGVSMDALARGSRIIMQDAGQPSQCLLTDLVESGGNITPGDLLDRLTMATCAKNGAGPGVCAGVVGGGYEAHLQVLPFGVPNFDNLLNNPDNGTYPLASRQIDQFLVNNRDYMVFSPVGSQGSRINGTNSEEVWPDLFDGTALDNDPNDVKPLQIPPPATAKNPVTVGGSSSDLWTVFGDYNDEENPLGFSSKGPATAGSLRTVPLITAPGTDGSGLFSYPLFNTAATNRSRDNDNNFPVEQEIDEANTGTSFSAGFATAAGAIVRDYFAQGFYPTGSRQTADRNPLVSGSLVRASLVASANFLEYLVNDVPPGPPPAADMNVFQSRGANVGVVSGINVGLLGNFVQGYGRIILDSVLPISNIPATTGYGSPDTVEYPAAGLIVYDMLATGEPPINNAGNTVTEKTFTVDGVNATGTLGAGRAIQNGQLRIALSWPDPPSAENSAGQLINDLDLEVESPGPDNDISTTGDNVVYDGNNYITGLPMPVGQWGQGRTVAAPAVHDFRNNIEAMHLSSFVSAIVGNQLKTGTWKVRVKRGSGGATPGQITGISGANEDTNGNGRFDAGEPDTDGDTLLDAGGQPFALVIAGPVFGSGTQSWASASHSLPASVARLDKLTYSCSDDARPYIFDPDATPASIQSGVTFQVVNAAGVVQDSEVGYAWSETPAGSHIFRPLPLPIRLAAPGIPNNGVLEGDNGMQLVMAYADSPRPAEARSKFQCTPAIIQSAISVADRTDPQAILLGGCDRDQFLDSGERMTYAIALRNFERDDDLTDVVATLTASGTSAAFIKVLDSPKDIGRIPGGQTTGVTFTILVDPALPQATQAQPLTLNLALDGKARGVRLNRTTYAFSQAVNADKESLHYSTDFPAGGREVRDFNRNLQIDRNDVLDPFKGVYWPDEDVTFSTMFVANSVNNFISNTLGEDLNNNGILDTTEFDVIPNATLDRGILVSTTPPPADNTHKVPFDFDRNNGGWIGLRHPDSKVGLGVGPLPVWEYTKTGACGAQTTILDGNPAPLFQAPGAAGIWHTGDTNPATPSAQICDEYPYPNDPATPTFEEVVFDILESPIISKVNQKNDARGFPYVVEFQRLGMNANIQTAAYAGADVDFDSDIDRDTGNCLLCNYWYYRFGDIYTIASFNAYNYGIDPQSNTPQRTFGPLTDPNGSVNSATGTVTGDEVGFTGFNQNTNNNSTSPIPVAGPNFRPFPSPGAPQICAPGCGNPALCCEQNTAAGPERNMDIVLLDYEDGLIYLSLGLGQGEPTGAFAPGPAGNRWQIGIGFWVNESTAADTDYGLGIDDVVLEWDETHPIPETGGAACTRFGGIGQPGGQQCATLNVDRMTLYECNESIGVTVYDPRRAGVGNVTVFGVSDSDATTFSTGAVSAKHPNKSFSIPETSTPGLFKGNVVVGTLFNNSNLLFTNPGNDTNMTFYYLDAECDGDGDGSVGENSFANLDNDNIGVGDNCPFLYNPLQEDTDGDAVGYLCDNCPGVSNASQIDSDADGVGDACDFDDVDFDGVVNTIDNCPDVYNADQTPAGGSSSNGAACDQNADRDGDGVVDKSDNCVRTANPTQLDSDGDLVGNACDGDCGNPVQTTLAIGTCIRTSATQCTADGQCPVTGHCSQTGNVCTGNNNCTGAGNTCIDTAQETCQKQGVTNNGTCGTTEDDLDADSVTDAIDNCPTVSNPTSLPGAIVQPDADSDGRGDACDPSQTVDDDNNGIPDDAITFNTVLACRKLPLAELVVLAKTVADVGGDGDPFADAGETARMSLVLRNASSSDLSNATLVLGSVDPDVACVTKSTIFVPSFPAGSILDTATLGNPAGRFEYVISASAATTNPATPAHADFFLSVVSAQVVGTTTPVPISTIIDIDLPGGGLPPKVLGPDNLPNTADDGFIVENFETERDGTAGISISNLPRGTASVLNDTIGVWVGTAPGGINTLAGVGCAGFIVPPGDPECRIDPDNDMDWHIHCPAGTCANTTGQITPTGGSMSHGGPNSLHWGHHFDSTSRDGDSTKFRQLAAFMSDPINLTPVPGVGDLELSFFHIVDSMDNNAFNALSGQAVDFVDVQIQTFDPGGGGGSGSWGFWDRLAPFQNVYDHIAYIWSTFGTSPTYCNLTPTDTGPGGFAPRGVKETMCFPNGVWSHCGNSRDTTNVGQCDGPGETGANGPGLWVQSKFSLENFLGQTVRIRWIAQSWEFDCCSSSYYELGGGWAPQLGDEGWWIDDIKLTGALQASALPPADVKAPGPQACPAQACNAGSGDGGFNMDLTVTEADLDSLVVGGEQIIVSAAATTNPGGCVGGGTQFRFFKNGSTAADVVQDWSSDPTYVDNPTADATYRVQARCSVFPACSSTITSANSTEAVQVYPADSQDISLTLTHTGGVGGTTTVQWLSRPQSVLVSGYDFFIGTINSMGDVGQNTLAGLSCASGNVAQVLPSGTPITRPDNVGPALGTVRYYLVGHSPLAVGGQAALGRRSNGNLRALAPVCP